MAKLGENPYEAYYLIWYHPDITFSDLSIANNVYGESLRMERRDGIEKYLTVQVEEVDDFERVLVKTQVMTSTKTDYGSMGEYTPQETHDWDDLPDYVASQLMRYYGDHPEDYRRVRRYANRVREFHESPKSIEVEYIHGEPIVHVRNLPTFEGFESVTIKRDGSEYKYDIRSDMYAVHSTVEELSEGISSTSLYDHAREEVARIFGLREY